jgi:hypothetical protein
MGVSPTETVAYRPFSGVFDATAPPCMASNFIVAVIGVLLGVVLQEE